MDLASNFLMPVCGILRLLLKKDVEFHLIIIINVLVFGDDKNSVKPNVGMKNNP
jgi:hypothetical protein